MSGVMKKTVYVCGLPPRTTHRELAQLFKPYGIVEGTDVIRSHGQDAFGYVDMGSHEEARRAILALDGTKLNERELFWCLISPLWATHP